MAFIPCLLPLQGGGAIAARVDPHVLLGEKRTEGSLHVVRPVLLKVCRPRHPSTCSRMFVPLNNDTPLLQNGAPIYRHHNPFNQKLLPPSALPFMLLLDFALGQ